jgi:hypothetical protein
MFVEPGIQVNTVIHAAAAKPDEGDLKLGQQGGSNAEVHGGLLF